MKDDGFAKQVLIYALSLLLSGAVILIGGGICQRDGSRGESGVLHAAETAHK